MNSRGFREGYRLERCFLLCAALALAPWVATPAEEAVEDGGLYARIRYLEGGLELTRLQDQEVLEATVNSPVITGDRLWTAPDGRAEIQLPDGTILIADRATRFEVVDLGGNDPPAGPGFRLWEGVLWIEGTGETGLPAPIRIDTPAASVFLEGGGEFRIDAAIPGQVTVSAYSGTVEVIGDTGSVRVNAGFRTVVFEGGEPSRPEPFNTARQDDFDLWIEERRLAYLRPAAQSDAEEPDYQDLPEEVIPYVPELNRYGGWYSQPVYGWVWRPYHLHVDWRPYSIGYWSHCPTGWTWISREPWGWYPYHYGRWHWIAGFGWGWIPGRVYSGAWVSWAYGSTYIGWGPLNYYNQPAFYGLHLSTYDSRGWVFVEYSRFHHRNLHAELVNPRQVLRHERVHRAHGKPRFRPRDLRDPDVGRRLVEDLQRAPGRSRRPVPATVHRSFRDSDVGERYPRRDSPARRLRTAVPSRVRPSNDRDRRPQRPETATGREDRRPPRAAPSTPPRATPHRAGPPAPDRRTGPDRKVLRDIIHRNRRPPVVREGTGTKRRPAAAPDRGSRRSTQPKARPGSSRRSTVGKGTTSRGRKASSPSRSNRGSRSKGRSPRSSSGRDSKKR